jgi:DNA-binding protein Fis
MKIKGWMMGIEWGVLCFTSWGLASSNGSADESVNSEPEEDERNPIFQLQILGKRSERDDSVARLTQTLKDYSNNSNWDNLNLAIEIILDNVNNPVLGLMLQVLRENSSRNDREFVIEAIKDYLDFTGQTLELQNLEEYWERDNLPLQALNEEDRKFVEECNPEGLESEAHDFLLNELSEYLLKEQPESDATSEESDNDDKENFSCEKLFPIARQLKANYTLEKLLRMDIDLEKLLRIELVILLHEREWTPEEEGRLGTDIHALDHSPEQRLLNAILNASDTPKTSLKRVKSIIGKGDVDVNLAYEGINSARSLFLIEAAEVYQNKGLKIVQFLLDNGADIEIIGGHHRWTALHGAVWRENIEIVRLLIDCGADVNARNEDGQTPLHLALHYEFFDIARLLLDHGADRDIRDDEDRTPFDIAMEVRTQIDDETEQREFNKALNKLNLRIA